MTEIDHWCTDNVVCPYCGNESDGDYYQSEGNFNGREQCEKCGEEYLFEAEFDATFITRKIEK